MLKRILLMSVMSLLFGIVAKAEMNYLHIATADGWTVIDLEKADKLTFNGGNMKILDNKGAELGTFSQSSLEMMYVNQTSGINEISDRSVVTTFRLSDNNRSVTLQAKGCFEVYTLDGQRVVCISEADKGKTVNLDALTPGTYIYNLGNYAVKCILK